jgi:hypothetical protein
MLTMEPALQILLDFVEGRMTAKEFEQQVYHNPDVERLLSDETLMWGHTYIKTNPYYYLIELNYDDPGDLSNAQGAVELFLQRKGIPFRHDTSYSEQFNLLLDAQPKWLDVDTRYLTQNVLPEAGERTGDELKQWLKARLKELFRYRKKPPTWIQGPAWPIGENGPFYFLGQIKLDDCPLFHDDGAAYLFVDPTSGETKTIIQLY